MTVNESFHRGYMSHYINGACKSGPFIIMIVNYSTSTTTINESITFIVKPSLSSTKLHNQVPERY